MGKRHTLFFIGMIRGHRLATVTPSFLSDPVAIRVLDRTKAGARGPGDVPPDRGRRRRGDLPAGQLASRQIGPVSRRGPGAAGADGSEEREG